MIEYTTQKLFNQDVKIKAYDCFEQSEEPLKQRINLYINIGYKCNGKCIFCSARGNVNDEFDIELLDAILKELTMKNMINRVAITGGEPSIYLGRLLKVISLLNSYDIDFITISTNGSNLIELAEMCKSKQIEGLHISRHSYNDITNSTILGAAGAASEADIKQAIDILGKNKVRLNCNLIKGHVDSAKEVKKYIQFALNTGVYKVGFVGLMQIDNYCKSHYIDYRELDISSIDGLLIRDRLTDNGYCDCQNYIYFSKGSGEIEVYFRQVQINKQCNYARAFNFNGTELSYGFEQTKQTIIRR